MSLYNYFRMASTVRSVALLALLITTHATFGQSPNQSKNGTVSVTETHELILSPEKIRLQMIVRSESRDGDNAMKLLRRQQERVNKELIALGTDPTSIEFSKPILSVGIPGVDDPENALKRARQQAAQAAQLRNLIPRGKTATPAEDDATELPQIFTASSVLIAEWKLENGLDEDAIMLPSKLRTSIDEKDFKGRKLKEALDPDEQLLLQPLIGSSISSYSSLNRQPEIQLTFVGKMTELQEEEALGAAYKKAKSHAVLLAKAAGVRLGNMITISSSTQNVPPPFGTNPASTIASLTRRNTREVSTDDPAGLKLIVSVAVSFHVE